MAQTRLGNIRKCKFQLWAFSADAPGNGNTVRFVVTRMIYLRPACMPQGASDLSGAGEQPAAGGLSRAAAAPEEAASLWDRESRDNIHRASPSGVQPLVSDFFHLFISMFARVPLPGKIDCFNFYLCSTCLG